MLVRWTALANWCFAGVVNSSENLLGVIPRMPQHAHGEAYVVSIAPSIGNTHAISYAQTPFTGFHFQVSLRPYQRFVINTFADFLKLNK
jgi:hypothetical protein